ncbi:MAG: hypothetical protein JXN60_02385 [Lentisphaerae bacterium]|nr:hypothetical protein [Lentisphaerota bacterium]
MGYQVCNYNPAPTPAILLKRRLKLYLQFLLKNRSFTGAKFRPQKELPAAFSTNSLHEVLKNYGMKPAKIIDLFDPRADLRPDMNLPLPASLIQQFSTVIDIGNIEHVFDTK